MGNEIVDADEIKDEVALLREKLKARGAETLHQKSKPNRKTQSKSTTNAVKEKKVSKIKEQLELLRAKLNAPENQQPQLPSKKKEIKIKPKEAKKNASLKKGRSKEASSSEAMVWINKGRAYGPKNEQKALECYEKAAELKPSYYLIYKDRGKLFHTLKKFEKAAENYELAEKRLIASPHHGGITDPRLREDKERALQKKLIRYPGPWYYEEDE